MDFDTRRDCQESGRLRRLEQASGIFFTGGNQLRLTALLGGTPVAKLIRLRNAHGVTVGGTSAGASILSEHMIAFGDEGSSVISGSVRLAPGLGLTNRFIIDQHFRQRDRLGRLLTALAYNPFAVGIGLDEDTAAFIGPDETIEVEGSGGVTVVDAADVSFSSIDQVSEGRARLHARPEAAHPGRRCDVQSAHAPGGARRAVSRKGVGGAMRVLDRSVYVGPSLYAHFPVIRLELDLGNLEEWPTGRLGGGFVDALSAALPGLAEHGCSYQEPGGFFRRMREDDGTWLGHVLEHVAIEMQNMAGEAVTFGKTRSAGRPGVYTVVYEYAQRDEGIAAGELGLTLICSLLPEAVRPPGSVPEGWAWDEARDEFIRFAQRRALGPSTASLVRAAENRGIPWLRLNDQSLVQLGHGRYQQRIQATVTSRTSHIAVELASDKEETNKILATLGLPVPKQELVQSEAQAVRAARRIGFPVVTKPYNGNHGRGISIRLTTDEEVKQGYAVAREHSRSVIVETFLEGDDHRLLVVNGEPGCGHAAHAGTCGGRRAAQHRRADRDREPGSAPRRRA